MLVMISMGICTPVSSRTQALGFASGRARDSVKARRVSGMSCDMMYDFIWWLFVAVIC